MANDLCYHGLDGISRDVHPTAQFGIPPGTDREFITEYLTNDRRHIRIVGKYYVNGSVQFTVITEGWVSSSDILPYIPNATIPDESIGWGWTGKASNITILTDIDSWGRPIYTSPANSPTIPVHVHHAVRFFISDEFLHSRRVEYLWRRYHPSAVGHRRLIVQNNNQFLSSNQHRDFILSHTNHPVA